MKLFFKLEVDRSQGEGTVLNAANVRNLSTNSLDIDFMTSYIQTVSAVFRVTNHACRKDMYIRTYCTQFKFFSVRKKRPSGRERE